MKHVLLLFGLLIINLHVEAQCSGGNAFATVTAPINATPVTISVCSFHGEYNTITGIVAGNSYTFTADLGSCITLHSGGPSGPVVAFGTSTINFTASLSGTYYLTINTNCSGCGTGFNCVTTTVALTGSGTGPCASTTTIIGCGVGYTSSTTGASSFVSNLCATPTPGLEIVYTYTATSTGNYSFNVTNITGGGYAIGYNTSCGATGWNCAGTAIVPGTTGSIALTAGTTYYFLLDATSTAASSITFQLTCPVGGPTIASDCAVAANVCSNASFTIDPNGFGLINEICPPGTCAANPNINVSGTNFGCLNSGELNSTWMIVNVLTGGSLTFSLGTPNSGTINCLDWSMWPYTPTTCAGITAGTLAPVRCNYNGLCEEFTGIAAALPAGATSTTNWEAPITVGTYTQYLICLSNFSSANTTVPLSFGGTAVVSCSPLAEEIIELTGENSFGINKLLWKVSSEYNVDQYLVERSEDGINYQTIKAVEVNGFSLDAVNYEFEDYQAINNTSYYRIKLIHNNGSTKSSNLIALEQQFMNEAEVVKAFPNPASTELSVLINSKMEANYELILTGINGKTVFNRTEKLAKGVSNTSINVSDYQNGLYFLSISLNGKNISSHKIVIE